MAAPEVERKMLMRLHGELTAARAFTLLQMHLLDSQERSILHTSLSNLIEMYEADRVAAEKDSLEHTQIDGTVQALGAFKGYLERIEKSTHD